MPAKQIKMKRLITSCFTLLLVTVAAAQKLMPWGVQLKTGEKFKVFNTSTNNINQQMMGQEIQINIAATISDSLYVKSETAQIFSVSKVTNRLLMEMDAMGQQRSYDSDKAEDREGEIGEKFKDKIGVSVDATVTKKGDVKITSAVPAAEPDAMGGMMNVNNDSATIAGLFLIPPSKEINAGESWTDSVISSTGKIATSYTYVKTENGVAYLSFTLKAINEGTTNANGMEVKSKVQSEGSGTLMLELKSGLVLERVTTMKLSGNSEVMGMEIPLTGESKTTVKVTRY